MPTTFTTALRTSLPGDGEQSGAWGGIVNNNMQLLEDAICGYTQITVTAANVTLTALDGTADQSRNMVLDLVGASTGARQIIVPAVEKVYLVFNSTTGGYTHTIKTASGTGVTIAPGVKSLVVCDGTNVVLGVTDLTVNFMPLAGGTFTGAVLYPDGTVGSPSIAFASDTNTGFRRVSADLFQAVCGGASVVQMGSSGVTITPALTTTAGASVGTTLAVGTNATVGGTLGIVGASTVGGTFGVTGAVTLNNNLTVGNALLVNGEAALNGTVTIGNAPADAAAINATTAVGSSSPFTKQSKGSFIYHDSSSNLSGVITVSTSAPSGGSNGDIWFQV